MRVRGSQMGVSKEWLKKIPPNCAVLSAISRSLRLECLPMFLCGMQPRRRFLWLSAIVRHPFHPRVKERVSKGP